MLELIVAPEMAPFTAALGVVGVIGVLEMLALMVFGPMLSHFHIHADFDAHGSAFEGALSWLHVGKVPLLGLVVLLLSGFGLAGAGIQLGLNALGFGMADALGACIPALGFGVATVRRVGGVAAKMLGDDPTVLTLDSFTGETAQITTGNARLALPAEARFTDKFGKDHYVMVAPESEQDEFPAGTLVVLGEATPFGFVAKRK